MATFLLLLLLVIVCVAAYYTYNLSSQVTTVLSEIQEVQDKQNSQAATTAPRAHVVGRWKATPSNSGSTSSNSSSTTTTTTTGSGTVVDSSSSGSGSATASTFTGVTPPGAGGLKQNTVDLSNLQLDTLTQTPPDDTIVLLGSTITFKQKGIYEIRASGSVKIANTKDIVYIGITNFAADSILGLRQYITGPDSGSGAPSTGIYFFDVATKVAVTDNENIQIFATNLLTNGGTGLFLGGLSIIEN